MTVGSASNAPVASQIEELALDMYVMAVGLCYPSIAFRMRPRRRIATVVTVGVDSDPLFLQLIWAFPLPASEER